MGSELLRHSIWSTITSELFPPRLKRISDSQGQFVIGFDHRFKKPRGKARSQKNADCGYPLCATSVAPANLPPRSYVGSKEW